MNDVAIRVPPHSMAAECSVLGACVLDNRALSEVADLVTADDFYAASHRLLFSAMLELEMAGKPFDAVTLAERLSAQGRLEAAGGLAYIAEMARDTPTAENARAYAGVVRDRASLRRLMLAGGEIVDMAFGPVRGEVSEILDQAAQRVLDVGDKRSGRGPQPIIQALPAWLDDLQRRADSGNGMVGISTGLSDLDALTCGMAPGDLWILAARPSMGKTSLACRIAESLAVKGQIPVLVFSLEMSASQLMDRHIASLARVPLDSIRHAKLDREQWSAVTGAGAALKGARLFIDDEPALSVTDMRARARRVKQRHGLGLVVVDHMQLVAERAENRTQEITRISGGLKAMAKSLNIPVLALSQLNRGVEQRANKRPGMADLRESGSIEQDADTIAFLYREGRYNQDFQIPGIAELNIEKQRNGPLGQVLLTWLPERSAFVNCDTESQEMYRDAIREASSNQPQRGNGEFQR